MTEGPPTALFWLVVAWGLPCSLLTLAGWHASPGTLLGDAKPHPHSFTKRQISECIFLAMWPHTLSTCPDRCPSSNPTQPPVLRPSTALMPQMHPMCS